ncbi:hypothetical protein LINGRAHAP2_LOCUS28365 [Linum grandiflorum]
MAWESEYRKVRVHQDSQAAIQLLLAESEITHQHSSEIVSFVSGWIGTGWSKLKIYIGKVTERLTILLAMVILYLLVSFYSC